MSSRPGIQLTVQHDADGGESPNRYMPKISAHVRVYWPPLATEKEILDTVRHAYEDTLRAVRKRNAQ